MRYVRSNTKKLPICMYTLVRDLDRTKHDNNNINSVLESGQHQLEEKNCSKDNIT